MDARGNIKALCETFQRSAFRAVSDNIEVSCRYFFEYRKKLVNGFAFDKPACGKKNKLVKGDIKLFSKLLFSFWKRIAVYTVGNDENIFDVINGGDICCDTGTDRDKRVNVGINKAHNMLDDGVLCIDNFRPAFGKKYFFTMQGFGDKRKKGGIRPICMNNICCSRFKGNKGKKMKGIRTKKYFVDNIPFKGGKNAALIFEGVISFGKDKFYMYFFSDEVIIKMFNEWSAGFMSFFREGSGKKSDFHEGGEGQSVLNVSIRNKEKEKVLPGVAGCAFF